MNQHFLNGKIAASKEISKKYSQFFTNDFKNKLVVGKDYAGIFGYSKPIQMIYMGGDNWKAIKSPDIEKIVVSAPTTKNALEYINQPSSGAGTWFQK